MAKTFTSSINYFRNEILKKSSTRPTTSPIPSGHRRRELIKKIQEITLQIVRSAGSDSGIPTLELRLRNIQWKDCTLNQRLTLNAGNELPLLQIKYTTHRKRFDVIFNLLSKIYRLLQTKGSVTKRELYYEDTELFGNQRIVNSALLDICSLLDACPWELRVFSTSKGLVAGALTFTTDEEEVIDCSKQGGVQVPQNVKGITEVKSSASFILLVEKDAAFQKLLDDGAHLRFGPCIMITGKGEPDINTRLLVHRLSKELAIPVFILVDADPYGVEIMCTYRFGSLAFVQYSEDLAVSEILWVGIHPTDIAKLSIPTVPFTDRDFAKARALLKRPYIQQNDQLLEQVNCLLEAGKKCEIENLSAFSPTFLTDMFLSYKITSKEVI